MELLREHRYRFLGGVVSVLMDDKGLTEAVQACRNVLEIATQCDDDARLADIIAAVAPVVDRHATNTELVLREPSNG
jgi:hypothetical protein